MQRIGIYGGSFDPVHRGHLSIAQGVAELLSLDIMHFVPCGQHAFQKRPGASGAQRLAMLKCAIAELLPEGATRWQADDIELARDGVSYTIDSCRWFRENYGPQAMLCLLMGTDAMNSFHRWKNWRKITALVNVVLVDRAVIDSAEIDCVEIDRVEIDSADTDNADRNRAAAASYQRLSPDTDVQSWLAGAVPELTAEAGQVTRVRLEPQPYSSTQIRQSLAGNSQWLALDAALPCAVRDFIEQHQLYKMGRAT